MGSNQHYPEEAKAHRVRVDAFWMDRAPVTNKEFENFVEATHYKTFAERQPDAATYPDAIPEMLHPGSAVFVKPRREMVGAGDWWQFVLGADWRHPRGPGSSIEGLENHPVVHVAYCDAEAYAEWAHKDLPTEAEWEFAARGGLDRAEFAWGDEMYPGGKQMANTWQGEFPWQNLCSDGYEGSSPVDAFPPNGYGLVDMIGNVWEWTSDWFQQNHPEEPAKPCCVPANPRGTQKDASYDPNEPVRIPRKVIKGGSQLCAPNYCRRYRPAARIAQPVDTSTSHIGFRCTLRPNPKF